MPYIFEKSITGFHKDFPLPKVLSSYNWDKNLYTKVFFNGKNYFVKFEKFVVDYELLPDWYLKKICNIENKGILKYHDILVIRKAAASENILVSICDHIKDRNFFEYVTYLHNDRRLLNFFVEEIVKIFNFLHQKGIVHKDINLDNFGLFYDGEIIKPILLDFNFYKESANGIIGTPEFLDPTYSYNSNYTVKNERRGLGLFIYFLFTFHLPFYNRFIGKDLRADQLDFSGFKKDLLNEDEFKFILNVIGNE